MAKINQLTTRQVATLTKPGLHGDGQRLYLQVSPAGTKSWLLRYGFDGRIHSMGLGSAAMVSLQEARRRSQVAYLQLLDGVNPLEQKRAQRAVRQVAEKTKSFAACAREYITAHQSGWQGKREAIQWAQSIEDFANPHIGKMPVRAITTSDIMRVLQPIWYTRTQTAGKLRSRIERILGWARVQELRSGDNPAAWRGHLDNLLPALSKVTQPVNRPALPWTETGEFVRSLQADSSIQCRALELLILTAARSKEILGARWEEFDLGNKIWIIPANRMKQRKEHRVPLSRAAVTLLKDVPKVAGNPYVFTGKASGGRLSPVAMQQKIRETNDTITVHGFRSTFISWAAARTNFPKEVREMALAHAIDSAVEAAYQRDDLFDKRRALMEAWGEFVTKPPAKVIPLRASGD